MVWFVIWSIACGFAQNEVSIDFFRAMQGAALGAAIVGFLSVIFQRVFQKLGAHFTLTHSHSTRSPRRSVSSARRSRPVSARRLRSPSFPPARPSAAVSAPSLAECKCAPYFSYSRSIP